MSGWGQTRRLALTEPWQDFWIDLYEDPPMGDWLAARVTASKGLQSLTSLEPDEVGKAGDQALASLAVLIARHNIVDRLGETIDLSMPGAFKRCSGGLIAAIYGVFRRAVEGDGLPPTPAKRARSRGPSSPKTKSLRATSSGR